jgi:hypothetical protein
MKRRSRASGTPIKGRRRKAPKQKPRNASKTGPRSRSSPSSRGTLVARLSHELREATEQHIATAEILAVISSSPSDLQPVFQAMLKSAVRLCNAKFGNIYRWDGDALHLVATQNVPAAFVQARGRSALRPSLQTPTGRMIATKTLVHAADMRAEKAYADRDPYIVAGVELGGVRTALVVPMLKDDELIGSFSVYRQEVRPFSDKQIALVQTSPLKLSSPSRTRACLVSYEKCCSKKPPPPMYSKLSAAPHSICRRCLTRSSSGRHVCAKRIRE